jgi:hypothetical protein
MSGCYVCLPVGSSVGDESGGGVVVACGASWV